MQFSFVPEIIEVELAVGENRYLPLTTMEGKKHEGTFLNNRITFDLVGLNASLFISYSPRNFIAYTLSTEDNITKVPDCIAEDVMHFHPKRNLEHAKWIEVKSRIDDLQLTHLGSYLGIAFPVLKEKINNSKALRHIFQVVKPTIE